jgi:hypothetical protein
MVKKGNVFIVTTKWIPLIELAWIALLQRARVESTEGFSTSVEPKWFDENE